MNGKSGLYIHIPFCANKCPYCDFYSVKYNKELAQNYCDNVIEEMKKYNGSFDTIYFGGGTPSILESDLIGKLLDAAYKNFDIDANSEITIECNPSKDLKNDFKQYKSYGINRVSIGMQSAVNQERFALGRRAGSDQVLKTVNDAKSAGIHNISLDVMLGTPKQTIESLDETFDFIKKADVAHISAYMLKIEDGTKFWKMQDKLLLPTDDEVANMYLKTVKSLSNIGFNQYEISNFSKPLFESRHNLKYWELDEYLGIGKSAHSLWNNQRFYYDEDFNKKSEGEFNPKEEEIFLGLRLNKGIKKDLIKQDLTQYINAGLMTETNDNVALTPKGMLVSNMIISELI